MRQICEEVQFVDDPGRDERKPCEDGDSPSLLFLNPILGINYSSVAEIVELCLGISFLFVYLSALYKHASRSYAFEVGYPSVSVLSVVLCVNIGTFSLLGN